MPIIMQIRLIIIQKINYQYMSEETACDCNDAHHTGHDYIHYRHVGDQCIHPDGHMHKIGEES